MIEYMVWILRQSQYDEFRKLDPPGWLIRTSLADKIIWKMHLDSEPEFLSLMSRLPEIKFERISK